MATGSTSRHPVGRILRQPNDLQSWTDLVKFFMGACCFTGTRFARSSTTARDSRSSLSPLPWWNAQPIMVPAAPSEAMGPLAPSARLAFDTLRNRAVGRVWRAASILCR